MRAIALLILLLPHTGFSQNPAPFPANRLRDFYRDQARAMMERTGPLPEVLPPFPGLDGGAWGHWGQNPESDNVDTQLGDIDFGGLLMQVTKVQDRAVTKGVNVRVGSFTVLFDPEQLTFVAGWRGDFVLWASHRYGITSSVTPGGPLLNDFENHTWTIPPGSRTKYQGLYRNGSRVVFVYRIGEATIHDSVKEQKNQLQREMSIDGNLPEGVVKPKKANAGHGETRALASAGPPLWADREVVTQGKTGQGNGPYVIDTLTIPYRKENPFKTPMRIGGLDIMPDGSVAVSTLMGDVWIVSNIDSSLKNLRWKRFASGLNQPLGLAVRDGLIHVIGRDQLTRLHDLNNDGEADFYECVTNAFPTTAGNSFALTLHTDAAGAFYWFTRSDQFGMTKFLEGGTPESIAIGLRGTNGTAVSEDGKTVLAMPQEGSWQPASAVFNVGSGSYHGFFGPKEEYGKYGYQLPLCFIPRGIDNSSGDAVFLPDDKRLGPLSGRLVGTSYGYCQHYLILQETAGETEQGGVIPLPGEFLSGAHRLRFSPVDGHLYVAGTDGWQSYARENGSLERVRYTGGALHLPASVETRENGFVVRFNCPLDPASVSVDNVFCQQWNYLYSGAYGSPEYSVKQPGTTGHDRVEVKSVHLLADDSVFFEIPQLHPVMQIQLYAALKTKSGERVESDIYYSVFEMGKPFTGFPGYTPIEKRPWNDFPMPDKNPVDPRLLEQESLGKIVGNERELAIIARREIKTVAGLRFEPRELSVRAGARVALRVTNADPSLPHNFVLVQSEQLQKIGEGSMKLAGTPEGASRHYVIDDPGVLALSPMLAPGNSYTVYFNAPDKPGNYPYLCTYPGHWQLTRGVFKVAKE